MLPVVTKIFPKPIFANNTFWCRLHYCPVMVTSFANALLLAAIAIIRYDIIIKNRNIHKLMSSKGPLIVIFMLWFSAILSSAPAVIGFWGKLTYDPHYGVCAPDFRFKTDANHLTYQILITFLFFCCINSTTGYCYYSIYKRLRLKHGNISNSAVRSKHFRIGSSSLLGNHSNSNQILWPRRQRRVNLILVVLFLGYLISYSPAAIATFLQMINVVKLSPLDYCILLMIMYSNSILDPYFILLTSQKYRRFIEVKIYHNIRKISNYCCINHLNNKITKVSPVQSK